MSAQEKAVIKAMRRHQRDGRRFRDLLVHCACGWKSPALKARKGSNDFALAREDQAKSFERHLAREVLAATRDSDESAATHVRELHSRVWHTWTELDGTAGEGWICDHCTPTGRVSVLTLHPCPTITALEGTK